MSQDPGSYVGTELDLFAAAGNWRSYWCSQIAPFLGRRVLEVGAGLGSVTRALCRPGVDSWLALEPDPSLLAKLEQLKSQLRLENLSVHQGTIAGLDSAARFDTIIYIDVLEHIQEDRAELHSACAHLEKGGHLIVLSPAHPFLYSAFDAAIGHVRRYSRPALRALGPAEADEVFVRYLDAVGLLASAGNRLFLRSSQPTPRQIRVWDRGMVPLSRILDPWTGYSLGKSVLGVWRKR